MSDPTPQSYFQILQNVGTELDAELSKALPEAKPLDIFVHLIGVSFSAASTIAVGCRHVESDQRDTVRLLHTAGAFVVLQVRLEEGIGRINRMIDDGLMTSWPSTPGLHFVTEHGSSATDIAIRFIRAVWQATTLGRTMDGDDPRDYASELSIEPPRQPHPRVIAWHVATAKCLTGQIIPKLPAFPAWEIQRDAGTLWSVVEREYERAQEQALLPGQKLTARQCAERLDLDQHHVRKLCREGKLDPTPAGVRDYQSKLQPTKKRKPVPATRLRGKANVRRFKDYVDNLD